MSRKLAREDAFKLIFEMELTAASPQDCINYLAESAENDNEMWAQKSITGNNLEYITQIVNTVADKKDEIDETISLKLKKWTIDRISKVNLSVLRLAVSEILYFDSVPDKVCANEAVELAKKYGGAESAGFINGVIGAILKDKEVKN